MPVGLRGADSPPRQHQLHRPGPAHGPRQPLRPSGARDDADPDLGLAELRVVPGDEQVAGHRELAPAAQRDTRGRRRSPASAGRRSGPGRQRVPRAERVRRLRAPAPGCPHPRRTPDPLDPVITIARQASSASSTASSSPSSASSANESALSCSGRSRVSRATPSSGAAPAGNETRTSGPAAGARVLVGHRVVSLARPGHRLSPPATRACRRRVVVVARSIRR